jgi:hypothetical protein
VESGDILPIDNSYDLDDDLLQEVIDQNNLMESLPAITPSGNTKTPSSSARRPLLFKAA